MKILLFAAAVALFGGHATVLNSAEPAQLVAPPGCLWVEMKPDTGENQMLVPKDPRYRNARLCG
jgi:hypothetical protein